MGEVRILGPIEVVVDDVPRPIGSPQLRRLLAALAVHADEVVSVDRLVEIMWGDAASMHAPSTLAKLVYRLRAALGTDGADGGALITQPPGYSLRVDGQLDAARFTALVDEARNQMSGADPEAARTLLTGALNLWRGPALDEFAHEEFAQAEAARLEELRASALEDRGDAELTLGLHVELIDELQTSIAMYPLHERFRSQLMLALYRAGRQPQALRAYEEFRRYLGDELGLEPSSTLEQLDRGIALQSPELDWTPPRTPIAVAPTPAKQLPSGRVTFVFTDIEHSTQLLRSLGPAYPAVLDRQRSILREAMAEAQGAEVNTEGDGMLFAFGDASGALSALVAAQIGLLAESWPDDAEVRIRMAAHTGDAVPVDDDYVALALHQAARVVDCAHGTQIVVSDATVAAVGGTLPPDVSLRPLGRLALRDFENGVALSQVVHPQLPSSFPPPRQSVAAVVRTPLPVAITADRSPFVGRTTDLEWLDTLWKRCRDGEDAIAFVTGPPGSGRSRLIAEFARRAHSAGAIVIVPDGAAGLASALATAPGGAPCVVVLDDADDLVGAALDGRPDIHRIVLASVDEPTGVKSGDSRALVSTRALAPFTAEDVHALLERAGEESSPELISAVLAETGGRASLVAAMVRQLQQRQTVLRVERALQRADDVRAQLRELEADIAAGVLERNVGESARSVSKGSCPYKGLARFDVADADLFFGRDRLVAALVAGVATAPVVAAIGASGSGKSSLVRAGLVSALGRGCLPGSAEWPVHIVRPGADPLGRLRAELGTIDLDAAARERVRALEPSARLLLVVDQFEEVFTLSRDEAARAAFIAAITDIDEQESPAAVVLTMRADYYGACAAYPALARLIERQQLLVGAMASSELRAAIVEPARRTGLHVEPTLVETIVADVADQPGMLPLVSTALLETWATRTGDTMTLASYVDAGGVRGALARLADATYSSLIDADREVARRVFLRLAQLGEGNDDVSRRAGRRELGTDAVTARVIDAFVDSRLLTVDGDTVEVAHEALLREWPELRRWLEQDRDGRRAHRALTEAALQWDADGRDASALYRGARLATTREWAIAHDEDLNALEREFLEASTELDQGELLRSRRTARRLRRLAVALSVLLVVALLAGVLALAQRSNADHQAGVAASTARHAEATRLATLAGSLGTNQSDLALLLGLEGHRLEPSIETEGGIESALVNVPPGVERVIETGSSLQSAGSHISPDGKLLAAARTDGTVDLWDIASGRLVRSLPSPGSIAASALFNSDGTKLITGRANGVIEVFDVASGRRSGAPIVLNAAFGGGVFVTNDGGRVLSLGPAGGSNPNQMQTIEWDRSDPDHPRAISPPFVFPVGPSLRPVLFSTDGGLELYAGNVSAPPVERWNIDADEQLPDLPIADPYPVPGTDPLLLAGVQGDHVVIVDTRTGAVDGSPFPSFPSGAPSGIVVSNDGRELATTDAEGDGRIVVYDVASRTQVGAISLLAGAVPTGFLPDGRLAVASGSQELIWRPGVTVPPIARSLGDPNEPRSGAWSEDGRTLATFELEPLITGDHPVELFDVTSGALEGDLMPPGALVNETSQMAVALSPDGSTAAVAERDGLIHLIDRATKTDLATLDGHRGSGPAGSLSLTAGEIGAVWSPRGDRIATAGADTTINVWDVTDVRHPKELSPVVAPGQSFPNPPNVYPSFSRDGTELLADNLPYGKLALFDVADGHTIWSNDNIGSFAVVGRLGYTKTGEVLATIGAASGTETGRQLVLFDGSTGRPTRTLQLPDAGISGDFLRGGQIFAVAGSTQGPEGSGPLSVVRLYDSQTGALIGEPLPIGTRTTAPSLGLFAYTAGWVVVSPAGNRFLAGPSGPGQTSTLWDVDLDDWEATACRIAGRNLSRTEWDQYLPGQPYRATCPQWPAGT